MTILPPVSVLITAGIKALRLLKKKELGELLFFGGEKPLFQPAAGLRVRAAVQQKAVVFIGLTRKRKVGGRKKTDKIFCHFFMSKVNVRI